jgi:hypothetical protein
MITSIKVKKKLFEILPKEIYPILDKDPTRAPEFEDRKSTHISNPLAIAVPRELSHGSKSGFYPEWEDIHGPIYELGSGWGTLIVPLALQYPSFEVIGYESSPIPYLASKIRASTKRLSNVKIYRKDFLKVNLKDAGMIICYLYPAVMKSLKGKFQKELAPGTWVVSHTFAVPDWQPHAMYEVEDLYKTKIYIYRILSRLQ